LPRFDSAGCTDFVWHCHARNVGFAVVACPNASIHAAIKDSGASRFPFVDSDANRAWLAVVCFADALVRRFQLLCLTGGLAVAEPRTLRWGLWHTPARLVHRARPRIVRILDGWATTDTLLDAYRGIALIT
jgi:hypothetical protein